MHKRSGRENTISGYGNMMNTGKQTTTAERQTAVRRRTHSGPLSDYAASGTLLSRQGRVAPLPCRFARSPDLLRNPVSSRSPLKSKTIVTVYPAKRKAEGARARAPVRIWKKHSLKMGKAVIGKAGSRTFGRRDLACFAARVSIFGQSQRDAICQLPIAEPCRPVALKLSR